MASVCFIISGVLYSLVPECLTRPGTATPTALRLRLHSVGAHAGWRLHAIGKSMPSQTEVCKRFSAEPLHCGSDEKLGIALETIGKLPINGLRHKPKNSTCGWYIWCGEGMSEESDFFKPLHVSHIREYLPEIERYLALPPGFRFLVGEDYEDVWCDPDIVM